MGMNRVYLVSSTYLSMVDPTLRGDELLPKGARPMTTVTLEHKLTETPEEVKARRNAEYLAKLEMSLQQHERGEVVSMTFAEWEEWIKRV